jgi:hypothetical protein
LAGTVGALKIDRPLGAVWNGYDVSDDGIYCRRRIALTPETQRRAHIGNFVARLHHPRITDARHRNVILSLLFLAKFVIPHEYGKRLHGDEKSSAKVRLQHLRNVATGQLDAAAFAFRMLRDRKLADRKFPSIIIKPKANLYSLDFHAEQQPNPNSRITLGTQVDVLMSIGVKHRWMSILCPARRIFRIRRHLQYCGECPRSRWHRHPVQGIASIPPFSGNAAA